MPAIYTHAVFASDVLKKLEKNTKNLINENFNLYIMFSQSFDNLYYYNFLSLKKGKDIRDLGKYAHTHKVKLYFKNIIDYIKENDLKYNSEVLAYLYGAINHYVSDSMLHPYINYRTGRFIKSRKQETKKYKGNHTNAELELDAYYYEMYNNKKFKKYKIYKDIPKLYFSKDLRKTIDYVFLNTFNQNNMGQIFNLSYNQSKNIYKLLMYDPWGIKKFFYKLIDFLTPNKNQKIAVFSLYKEPIKEKFFNEKHDYWCNPIDVNMISEESWNNLYKKAIKKATLLIKNTNLFLRNKISEEKFYKLLGNNNYTTGMDLSDKRITQYYEY